MSIFNPKHPVLTLSIIFEIDSENVMPSGKQEGEAYLAYGNNSNNGSNTGI